MRHLFAFLVAVGVVPVSIVACSSDSGGSGQPTADSGADTSVTNDAGGGGDADGGTAVGCSGPCPASKVKYLIVVVQENHTFDNHFGAYCTAPAGSNPTCTTGPACCEAAPALDHADGGAAPVALDDALHSSRDPDHSTLCETGEMNGGAMDQYVSGQACSNPGNFAVATGAIIKPYWDLAGVGAIADRYFQPIIGQSSSNDMYFARAQFVFTDNKVAPPDGTIGESCSFGLMKMTYTDKTIGDLLTTANVPWTWYMEGYKAMSDAVAASTCPPVPSDCVGMFAGYPCTFDPSDNPFEYYDSTRDKPEHLRDLAKLADDLTGGTLPAVTFVKGIGYKTEHPGSGDKLSDGVKFVTGIVGQIQASQYANDVLVVVTYDEGGGYFDHIKPPADNTADNKPYGTRVPLIALGPFVKKNFVSHVVMEHSSLVKFIEWNWLGMATGQLTGRDANVNNIGSVLDPATTGVKVPE